MTGFRGALTLGGQGVMNPFLEAHDLGGIVISQLSRDRFLPAIAGIVAMATLGSTAFVQDGKSLAQWTQFGAPSGLFIDRTDVLYVTDSISESDDPKKPGYNPGFEQGIRIGSAKDGKVTAFIPIPLPPGAARNAPEGVAANANGGVHGADVVLKDVRKYVKQ
jgi:hypothetical protein